MLNPKNILPFFILFFLSQTFSGRLYAQKHAYSLYEQASEVSGLVVQYGHDIRAIQYFYGPMSSSFRGAPTVNPPEQCLRLQELNQEYLDTLAALDFDNFSIHGQVDYILLKRKIEKSQEELAEEASRFSSLEAWFPFAENIYAFERDRRRGTTIAAEKLAVSLNEALIKLEVAKTELSESQEMEQASADYALAVSKDLKARLKSAFDFYNGYDIDFTWWVPAPYEKLDKALDEYEKVLQRKGNAKPFDDGSHIGGKPIGSKALAKALRDEMIPYTAEELLKLAEKEWAWCEAELLKASNEMGFGDDWKAAQEKVKNNYVPIGRQPELIVKLYNEANDFIKARDLVTFPPIGEETWGMTMMTPEQQQVSPFFLGGRNILIAYPTDKMTHEQKLMAMRGNNINFSRGIVQHELLPGHHLQYYMNSRYKPYRSEAFRTPFWTEGWTLYWELLLYDLGFPETAEDRIGMLFWRMHRCARITFSIKYHLGEWTPQQCIDYLVDKVGHEPATAHGEVKRSFEGNYGPLYQLAYLTGGLQVWALKKEIVDSGKVPIKEFHDRFMKENYMPIEMLRATFLNEKLSRDFKSTWRFYPL